MKEDYEKKYHLIEERNWWFLARQHMIRTLLEKEGVKKSSRILDIGCSGGALIRYMKKRGYHVTGCDISKKAIDLCKRRGICDAVCADAAELPFPDEHFDTIIASDILEHMKNDVGALREWSRVLKKGGKLIIFVPAFKSLWSTHDTANRHYRRYSKKMLLKATKKAGLRVSRCSYWNFTLFFPVYLMRRLGSISKKKGMKTRKDDEGDLYDINPLLNRLLLWLLKAENSLLKMTNLPVGISIFAIARKERG